MSKLNSEIQSAINLADFSMARELLRKALKEADGETYFLASQVAVDDIQKREFLQKAIDADPFHSEAIATLRGMDDTNPPKTPKPHQTLQEPTQVTNTKDEIILPLASVLSETIVYTIPHSSGTKRTTLLKGAEVEVIARTANENWINVTYISSVGQRVFGWTPTEDLSSVTYRGNPANKLDLTISELDLNKRNELQELVSKDEWQGCVIVVGCCVGFFGFVGFLLMITASYTEPTTGYFFLIILYLLFIGGFILALITGFQELDSEPPHGIKRKQIKSAIKARKSVTELEFERQQQLALLNIAGNMATRLVPNNQRTVVKNG